MLLPQEHSGRKSVLRHFSCPFPGRISSNCQFVSYKLEISTNRMPNAQNSKQTPTHIPGQLSQNPNHQSPTGNEKSNIIHPPATNLLPNVDCTNNIRYNSVKAV